MIDNWMRLASSNRKRERGQEEVMRWYWQSSIDWLMEQKSCHVDLQCFISV